jgi:hypothetical protein
MAVQTLASIAQTLGESRMGSVVYASYVEDPIYAHVPLQRWQGDGSTLTYDLVASLPTASETALYGAYTETAPTYATQTATLSNIYSQVFMSTAARGAGHNKWRNQFALNVTQMGRACGAQLRARLMNGQRRGVSIGATATTKGVDGFLPNPQSTAELFWLDFNDTGDVIKLSSDQGTSYGATITLGASDWEWQPITDGDGLDHLLLFDVSDSAGGGNWTTSNAATGITVTAQNQIDGINALCHPDQRIWGNRNAITGEPTTNGDALSFSGMDALLDLIPFGVRSKLAFFMAPRTRIAYKALYGTAAYPTVDDWMGTKLSRPQLSYEGVPVIANPSITLTGTVGTTTTATTVYLVYFDTETGYHLQYDNASGRGIEGVSKQSSSMSTDEGVGSEKAMPWFFRVLPESETGPYNPLRIDGWWAGVCKNQQAIAGMQGITS